MITPEQAKHMIQLHLLLMRQAPTRWHQQSAMHALMIDLDLLLSCGAITEEQESAARSEAKRIEWEVLA